MKKIIYIILIVGVLVSLALSIRNSTKSNEIRYFDYNRVYNECDLKVDLEKKLKTSGSEKESQLDSLKMEVSFLSQSINQKKASSEEILEFEKMKNRYLTFKERYEEEHISRKEEYYGQIRNHVNVKAESYAIEKGIDFYFASMGDGVLMYGSEIKDETEEFLNFLNQ